MYYPLVSRRRHVFFSLACLALMLLSASATAENKAFPSPIRLRVKVEKSTVKLNEGTHVIIEFLDRGYKPAPNDADRTIQFALHLLGVGQTNAGEISSPSIKVPKGAWSSWDVTFKARAAGRWVITASSQNLLTAQTLVSCNGQRSTSWLSRLLDPAVYAEPKITLQFLPPALDAIQYPANDLIPAELWLGVNPPLRPKQKLRVILKTDCDCRVSYPLDENPQPGFHYILFDQEGDYQSQPIHIRSAIPRTVKVSARLELEGPARGGQESDGTSVLVRFVRPEPKKILLNENDPDGQAQPIPPYQRRVPLSISLADQDGAVIKKLEQDQEIKLTSLTHSKLVSFEPMPLILRKDSPFAQPALIFKSFPADSETRVQARDPQDHLEQAVKSIPLQIPPPLQTTLTILGIVAGLGGLCGSLVRCLYHQRFRAFWPRRVEGWLETGFMVDIGFGFLFGLILFLAVKFGVIKLFDLWRSSESLAGQSKFLAYFFGVVGGYGGITGLDRISSLILPGPQNKKPKEPRR